MKLDDVHRVQGLLHQLGYESSLEDLTEMLKTSIADSEVFVATEDEHVVAFMSLIYFYYFPLNCRVCRITGITVDEACRGNGMGSALIQFAVDKAKEHSCKQLEVTTSLAREKTQRYYEYCGFEKTSYRYYQTIDKP